jgi:hypothetical protein
MESIEIKSGLFEITLKKEEVKQLYEDNQFLRDAILSVLNPEVADKSDLPFDSKTYLSYLKTYFYEKQYGYNAEFIEQIFSKKL